MSGKFGPEESLTMEPECVQPLKERCFIWRHRSTWEEKGKKPGCYLALEEAKVRRWDCWPGQGLGGMSVGAWMDMTMDMRLSNVCRVGVLAFQHSLV